MSNATIAGDASSEAGHGAVAAARGERPAQVFWKRYFQFYDTLNLAIPYRQMIETNVRLLEPVLSDTVLDAGTGTGNIAIALKGKCRHVVGMDFCEPALVKCREKWPDGDFRFGDLSQRLEFEDGAFDKVVSCNVIYTLAPAAQDNAVRELYRVLKPGGLAVVTVFRAGFRVLQVYRETLRSEGDARGLAAATRLGIRYSIATVRIFYYVSRIKKQEKTGDYTFFTEESLRRLMESAGFAIDGIEPTLASQCLAIRVRKPVATGAGK